MSRAAATVIVLLYRNTLAQSKDGHLQEHPYDHEHHRIEEQHEDIIVTQFIGGGTTGALGALAPILLQQRGHCPHSKLLCTEFIILGRGHINFC